MNLFGFAKNVIVPFSGIQSQNIGPSATGITSHMPTTQYREPSFVKITQHMLANQTRITNELKKSAALGRAPCSTPKT